MKPAPILATTQQHLDIDDITNNVILLKDGSVAMVIKTSAVNFNLLSEQEQEATIYSYASLLNSLTFPIQILIRSQKKDISKYLKLLKSQEEKTHSPKRRSQISKYRQFIGQIVKKGNVLDKKFYCIIPFSRIELGLSASNPLTLKKQTTLPYDKNYIITKALTALNPKRDHLIRQFSRIGLLAEQLTTQELTKLLYNIYNPEATKGVKLTSSQYYKTPLVQPAKNIQKEDLIMNDDSNQNQGDSSPNPLTNNTPSTPPANTPTPTPTPEPKTPTLPTQELSPTPEAPADTPTPKAPADTPTPKEPAADAQSTVDQASQNLSSNNPTPTPSE